MGVDLGCKVHLTWAQCEYFAARGGIRIMFTITDVPSPVSDRDTDVVQTSGSDICEIRFSDELSPQRTPRNPEERYGKLSQMRLHQERGGKGLTLSQ